MDQSAGTVICSFCNQPSSVGARFCWSCGRSLQREKAPSAPTEDPDEMRPITALFADIVGSTRLGEHLGPDEVKSLVGECVGRMSRAVEEFGGLVQAYMGDGICAYFGVPAAHGDDAERAARAALRILQAIEEQRRDIEAAWGVPDLNVRVGINSGPAAVGLVGGAAPQQVALGDATNVAARLQAEAEPGTIAVGGVTAAQLEDRFLLEPLGELEIKGRAGRVAAWNLLGLRPTSASRTAARFVGRDAELTRMKALGEELRRGRGEIVLVTGATGMGKSRLLDELRKTMGQQITWLQGHCLPYGGEPPYGPFVEMLRGWLGVGATEPEISIRTKLRARLPDLAPDSAPRLIAFLSRLLSLRLTEETEAQIEGLGPEELGRAIRESFVEWAEALTERAPVVLALEDLHCAEATTCLLAEELASLTDTAALCLAATLEAKASSEGWKLRLRLLTEYPHRTTEVAVAPLTNEASTRLVSLLTPAGTLEPELTSEIVRRAEGNPFFLKELLRSVIEGGGVARDNTWTISADLPPALESLLVARIDRLPQEVRRVAQTAAVLGLEFSFELLQKATEADGLRQSLSGLLRAEIIRELRRYPALEYTFTSSLLHESVLSTLTPARLKALHGRIAELLEQESDHLGEENPVLLAFYYYRSDHQDKALRYLEAAAAKAESLDASAQASELWRRALKSAQRLGDDDSIRRVEAALAQRSHRT